MKRLAQTICGVLALVLGLLAASPAAAQEDELKVRKLGIARTGPHLSVSFSYRDAFTPKVKEKLKSGLPTRVMVQINLERQGKSKPVAFWFRSATIVYDLWEEEFVVTVRDSRGRRSTRVETLEDVVSLTGALWSTKVASTRTLEPGTYRLQIVAEANPVSKEMVEDIRRWLARPTSRQAGAAARSNFFGSFVSIFVDRKIGEADKTVAFVSQWFEVPGE